MAGNPSYKNRKRTALLTKVRQQMEFYFSDASLGKDRFLQERINESADGHVRISLFLNFNKLRSITQEETVIREALKASSLLEVSQDGLWVKRMQPRQDRGNVDELTLYVENLPLTADHEWLKSKFSVFGPVQYVSLPRYKTTKSIKGFAFIEFDAPESVAKACQFFSSPDGDVSALYEKESSLPVAPTVVPEDFDEDELTAKHGTKRKHDDTTDTAAATSQNQKEPSQEQPAAAEPVPAAKKTGDAKEAQKPSKPVFSPDLLPLKVMPKTKWDELKKRYLELQKASYKALKQKLKILHVDDDNHSSTGNDDEKMLLDSDEDEMPSADKPNWKPIQKSKPPPKKTEKPPSAASEKPLEKLLTFEPDVILHLVIKADIPDKRNFVKEYRSIPRVQFVDVASPTNAYIRCDTREGTLAVKADLEQREKTSSVTLLEGEDESTYWKKILDDMEKRSKVAAGRRGKAKIVQRADKETEKTVRNSHIKFE